jgi:hypothetical protein
LNAVRHSAEFKLVMINGLWEIGVGLPSLMSSSVTLQIMTVS